MHSLGRSTLAGSLRGDGVALGNVSEAKYAKLIKNALNDVRRGFAGPKQGFELCDEYLTQLVRFARLNYTDTKVEDEVRDLAIRYNLVPPESVELEDEMHRRLREILRTGVELAQQGVIDYTDMIYVPYVLNIEPPQYDFVFVDEAQDYSALALKLTLRLVGAHGRLLFVGDPRQSVFGFAGADTDALDRIVREANASILPLSISYRCPKKHVRLAQILAPEIETHSAAREGRIFWISESAFPSWVRESDMVLCRANAPLVRACLRLVQSGRRAFVAGQDIGRQILRLAKKVFRRGFDNYEQKLADLAAQEEARLRNVLKDKPQVDAVVAQRLDIIEALRHFVQELETEEMLTLEGLNDLVEATFSDQGDAIELSTVHRAKGKEADRVFLLYPELMPASYAKTPEAVRGEACVQFVALTRAKQDLVFVESPTPLLELWSAGR